MNCSMSLSYSRVRIQTHVCRSTRVCMTRSGLPNTLQFIYTKSKSGN